MSKAGGRPRKGSRKGRDLLDKLEENRDAGEGRTRGFPGERGWQESQLQKGRWAAYDKQTHGWSVIKRLAVIWVSHNLQLQKHFERLSRCSSSVRVERNFRMSDVTHSFWSKVILNTKLTWFIQGRHINCQPKHQIQPTVLFGLHENENFTSNFSGSSQIFTV